MKGFDLFGSQVLFRFKGKASLQTIFGSWFSLIIVAVIGIRLGFIINEVWSRSNPSVISSERQVNSPAAFEFSKETGRFAFGMQDPITYSHYIDTSIYTVTIMKLKKVAVYNQVTQAYESTYERTYYTPERCTAAYFEGIETKDFFLSQSYSDLYCLSLDETYTMEGDFAQESFQYFSFIVNECASNCADDTLIYSKLNNGFFAVYYTDVIVSPEDKETPFQEYARDVFWITSPKQPKLVDFYYRNTYIESDFGWVYEDTTTKRFAQFSNADVQVIGHNLHRYYGFASFVAGRYLLEDSVDYIVNVNFRFEKQKENLYRRKYKNINQIISEIGGFAQTLLAIGYILCRRLSQLELNKEIINRAFNFENQLPQLQQSAQLPKRKLHKQKSRPPPTTTTATEPQLPGQSLFPSSQNFQLTSPQSFRQQKTNLNSQTDKSGLFPESTIEIQKENALNLSNLIQQKSVRRLDTSVPQEKKEEQMAESRFKTMMNRFTGSMNLNVLEYVKFFIWPFGKVKEKKQIIDFSIDKLYYHLDVLNVVKKLLEVDKLKRLLMDEDQLNLFNCWPKPLIRSAEALGVTSEEFIHDSPSDFLYQDTSSDLQKTQLAYNSYLKIIKKEQKQPFEQKLLKLMDRNLVHLFELNQNTIEAAKEPLHSKLEIAAGKPSLEDMEIKPSLIEMELKQQEQDTQRVSLVSQGSQQLLPLNEEEEQTNKSEFFNQIVYIDIPTEENRNPIKTQGFNSWKK